MSENTLSTGRCATNAAAAQALLKLMPQDERLLVLDADVASATYMRQIWEAYPERFLQLGVAEQDMVLTAAGLATTGFIPVVSTFAVFASMRALEPIRTSVAYPNLNVKFFISHAGITIGENGVTHQAVEDLAILRSIPNMTVLTPCDGTAAESLVKAALQYTGPVYLRLARMPTKEIHTETPKLVIGGSSVLRHGTDVLITACGIMVEQALAAAELLAGEGIATSVIDTYSIKPLDAKTILKAASQTRLIVTCEDHNTIGGLGSAVAEALSEQGHMPPLVRVGVQDAFAESGKPEDLMRQYGLDAASIAAVIKKRLAE